MATTPDAVQSKLRNKLVFAELKNGDIVSLMVRGYRPEGEIYRVLFFVADKSNVSETAGIYGSYENELENCPDRFVRLDDIIALDFVSNLHSEASSKIRMLVLERNSLKKSIARHNKFIKENFIIAG